MKIIKGLKEMELNSGFKFEESVLPIIKRVSEKGDLAVKQYAKKFDNEERESFELSQKEIKLAYKRVKPELISAVKTAIVNIKKYAEEQMKQLKDFEKDFNGRILGQRISAIESVLCYVPGGKFPLLSSALMTVIPAKVAGVKNIYVTSPKIKPEVIVAADLAGAEKIFSLGGVQAIAAFTYGTELVPKVDKIVGPGNKYVTSAKKAVYGDVGIDSIAGPSEIMVIADNSADPVIIAADLLAQAEHDENVRLFLVTNSSKLAELVQSEVKKQLDLLLIKDVAAESVKKGLILLVDEISEAVGIANTIAPEHLEILVKDESIISRLNSFGALFIGQNCAEVFGDYCSGPNHTLPTSGTARFASGLSVVDFVRFQTTQRIKRIALKGIVDTAVLMASAEGLEAHKRAALTRLNERV